MTDLLGSQNDDELGSLTVVETRLNDVRDEESDNSQSRFNIPCLNSASPRKALALIRTQIAPLLEYNKQQKGTVCNTRR